jgi:ribosomal protein S18 acetylase RimI-like enzyme
MNAPVTLPFPPGWCVRGATTADADQLAELESVARASLVGVRGGDALLDEQPAVGDWSAVLGSSASTVWVAEIDGVLVGYLQLEHCDHEDIGNVRQVWVDPDARELGFGDELLAAAIEHLRAHGATTIESYALPGDRDTKNLYERAGVTARKIIVSKRLDRS